MPQLIMLLAWRLVIESFENFFWLSSWCMQIGQTSFPAVRFAIYVNNPYKLYLQYFLCFIPEIHLLLCKRT